MRGPHVGTRASTDGSPAHAAPRKKGSNGASQPTRERELHSRPSALPAVFDARAMRSAMS
eukprot:6202486-Pleurochrysis_carterae.AAC.1